jgi:ketopantoate reductase
MRIGVLGAGAVGRALGTKLVELGVHPPLWVRLLQTFGTPNVNVHVVH